MNSDTTQPIKYFIVSPTLDDYDDAIHRMKLPPGQCFYCETLNEAWCDVMANKEKGIRASIILPEGSREQANAGGFLPRSEAEWLQVGTDEGMGMSAAQKGSKRE